MHCILTQITFFMKNDFPKTEVRNGIGLFLHCISYYLADRWAGFASPVIAQNMRPLEDSTLRSENLRVQGTGRVRVFLGNNLTVWTPSSPRITP